MKEDINALDRTIGEYVADDIRVAKVFDRHGIDFCCGGSVPLGEMCRDKNVDPALLLDEVERAKQEPLERTLNYNAWELPFLADYIINTHHSYLKDNVNKIADHARKISEVHGKNHPELLDVARIFGNTADDLMAHLREEEEVLFPAIRRIVASQKQGSVPDGKDVEILSASLKQLNKEHEEVGEAIHTIRKLTRNFAIPEDACNTFRVTYHELQEFEDDLHKHVHLENNILFPKGLLAAKQK